MRKGEKLVYDALRRNKPDDVRLRRYENFAGEGDPDVNLMFHKGPQCWVELKATRRPVREQTRLMRPADFERGQLAWHVECKNYGHPSWVLIRDEQRTLYLIPGWRLELCYSLPQHQFRVKHAYESWAAVYAHMRAFRGVAQ